MRSPISVTILTKNSQKHLAACLHTLQDFEEVIVLDNGSTDSTLAVAGQFPNVKVVHSPFIGFGPLKNLAASHAAHPWILSIDSDEVLTKELMQELLQLNLSVPHVVYSFKRNNFYRKRLIKACGWDNDYVERLYHKETTRFADLSVHEYIQTEGLQVQRLKGTLNHYSYDSISQLIQKSDKYTSLFAEENRFIKRSSPFKSYCKGAFSFFRNYVLQKGFLYGYEGLTISFTNAANAFYKYMKLHEANLGLQITLVLIPSPEQGALGASRAKFEALTNSPEEIIVVTPGEVSAAEKEEAARAAPARVRYWPSPEVMHCASALQQVIAAATGEYVVVAYGDTVPAQNLIRDYRQKARSGTFYSEHLIEGAVPARLLAFWKRDFLKIDLTGNTATGGASSFEKLEDLLHQQGLVKARPA
ncbi:MAG: glycosyltransferase [Hymenobacteraceae bacterium]|nr:glycosyltransferase [Hymenobacteraceae bacterium]MDX5481726.1 glycosyltransferase [Hymenobacteraceae bacterium]